MFAQTQKGKERGKRMLPARGRWWSLTLTPLFLLPDERFKRLKVESCKLNLQVVVKVKMEVEVEVEVASNLQLPARKFRALEVSAKLFAALVHKPASSLLFPFSPFWLFLSLPSSMQTGSTGSSRTLVGLIKREKMEIGFLIFLFILFLSFATLAMLYFALQWLRLAFSKRTQAGCISLSLSLSKILIHFLVVHSFHPCNRVVQVGVS